MHFISAKSIWDLNKYNRADTYSIIALRRSLYISTKAVEDIARLLSDIKCIRNQLSSVNVNISDEEMICVALDGYLANFQTLLH